MIARRCFKHAAEMPLRSELSLPNLQQSPNSSLSEGIGTSFPREAQAAVPVGGKQPLPEGLQPRIELFVLRREQLQRDVIPSFNDQERKT